MRYRRLREQLRDQNWTAIGIDLVIVVVGVFIGLQVANWNDSRREAKRGDEWFRLNLPHEVQAAVSAACGDKVVAVGDYAGIGSSIDYLCSTGLSPEEIAAAAAILRADTEVVRLLRLRVANVETNLSNLSNDFGDMRDGLRATTGKAQ